MKENKDNVKESAEEKIEYIEPDQSHKYWKERCELAEECIRVSPDDPDVTTEQIDAHAKWTDYINTATEKEDIIDLIERTMPNSVHVSFHVSWAMIELLKAVGFREGIWTDDEDELSDMIETLTGIGTDEIMEDCRKQIELSNASQPHKEQSIIESDIEKKLLQLFGYGKYGLGANARGQLKIFEFMDWYKSNLNKEVLSDGWVNCDNPPEEHTDILIRYNPHSKQFPDVRYITQSSYYNNEYETLKPEHEAGEWMPLPANPIKAK